MDSETRDILDDAAELGPDGYDTAAGAELGQLVGQSVARTGPLDPDAVAFDSLLNIDYDDCAIGACARSTRVPPPPGQRPEMTFWDAHNLIAKATAYGLALKVTARTCTLIDRALKTAQEHSRRTEHVMLTSYHYEMLPGRIGGTEVTIVDDVLDTNVRPADVGWRFVTPTPTVDVQATIDRAVERARQPSASTIAADVGNIRAWTIRNFRDHGDAEALGSWTNQALADQINRNKADADAQVLRILAARLANAGTNENPLLTLTDVAAALVSLTTAVAALAGRELSDDAEPEAFKLYKGTVEHLIDAADGVVEMAGWI
jgi:hypothetical protein